MEPLNVDAAAEALIQARVDQIPIVSLPAGSVPGSAAEAWAIDDRVAALTGWPVLGWKVGCTSAASQALLGTDGPFAGRIYGISGSGSALPHNSITAAPYVEGEFAFTIGQVIEPAERTYDADRLLDKISELRPAIEVVGGRFTKLVGVPVQSVVADAGSNTHLVLGDPVGSWAPEALANQSATMAIDGQVATSGSSRDVLGNPINSVVWLVNHLANRNVVIEAGQVITTGTATGVTPLPAGSTALAEFGPIGSVSTSLPN